MLKLLQSQSAMVKGATLFCVVLTSFLIRMFSVIRYESIIHEFDPWFNYRSTQILVERGLYAFWNWFDELAWYPWARHVGPSQFPGMMLTAGAIFKVLHFFHIPIHIREVCVFIGPLFSGLTALSAYFFTTQLKDSRAGLLAAAFMGIVPGYVSRSVAGSYDYEAIAIFIMVLTFALWIKALRRGSIAWGTLAALSYFAMTASWGGYQFIMTLIPLHVFVLLVMGRYDSNLYTAYCSFYIVGSMLQMQVPFTSFAAVEIAELLPALGTFGLLQIFAFFSHLKDQASHHERPNEYREQIERLKKWTLFILITGGLLVLFATGKLSIGGRIRSLFDFKYAKKRHPIISSVSEHQPASWGTFFTDLHILTVFMMVGLYICIKEATNEQIFVIIYVVTACYFASVMIRLVLTLSPIACIAGAIGISHSLDYYLKEPTEAASQTPDVSDSTDKPSPAVSPVSSTTSKNTAEKQPSKGTTATATTATTTIKEKAKRYPLRAMDARALAVITYAITFFLYVMHCTFISSYSYSSPSVVMASTNRDGSTYIIDDFREGYSWLRYNTPLDAKVMSWWDYGYQITGFSNRTTLVDNNTRDFRAIAVVGVAMSSSEEEAYKMCLQYDVDYVLVVFGGYLGFSGDDINKFLWMVRIGGGEFPEKVKESDYYGQGQYRVDKLASKTMLDSIMYKMSYYRLNELYGGDKAYDKVRQVDIGQPKITLSYFEEAFTSEHWIVRIYKTKKPDNLGRSHDRVAAFEKVMSM